jgi:hypothetical protein
MYFFDIDTIFRLQEPAADAASDQAMLARLNTLQV